MTSWSAPLSARDWISLLLLRDGGVIRFRRMSPRRYGSRIASEPVRKPPSTR